MSAVLDKLNIAPFKPSFSLQHPLIQTIVPVYLPTTQFETPFTREIIELPDGDKLAIAIAKPDSWVQGQRVVVLIHGLAGCQNST